MESDQDNAFALKMRGYGAMLLIGGVLGVFIGIILAGEGTREMRRGFALVLGGSAAMFAGVSLLKLSIAREHQ